MPLAYTRFADNFTDPASGECTTPSRSFTLGELIVICYVGEDNEASGVGAITITNSGTAQTWNVIASTPNATPGANCKVDAWWCVMSVTQAMTITLTTAGSNNTDARVTTFQCTGQHAITPVPAGNIFSGTSGTDISQSITPTASGSMLLLVVGDWDATNTFAAIADCTLETPHHRAGAFTAADVRPTTQPRTDANAFTIGETDTAGTIAWVAFEVRASGNEISQIDKLFLYDSVTTRLQRYLSLFQHRARELGLGVLKSAANPRTLRGEKFTVVAGGNQERSVTDSIFLKDYVIKDLLKRILETLFVNDYTTKVLEKRPPVELLFLNDRSVRTQEKRFLDFIFLLDLRTSGRELTVRDYLFLLERDYRLQEHRFTDKIFLGDAGVGLYEQASGAVVRAVTDGIFLNDYTTKLLEKRITEYVFLRDFSTKILELLTRDFIFIKDYRVSTLERLLLDKLLLVETMSKVVELKLRDNLLVKDYVIKLLEKIARDFLYLYDYAAAVYTPAPGAGDQERTVTDGLFLRDETTKQLLKTAREALFLNDYKISDLTKIILDKILLGDAATRQPERTRYAIDKFFLLERDSRTQEHMTRDSLLIGDFMTKIRELRLRDNVLLGENVYAIFIGAVTEYLTSARTRMVNLFGARDGTVQWMGINIEVKEYLGIYDAIEYNDTGLPR